MTREQRDIMVQLLKEISTICSQAADCAGCPLCEAGCILDLDEKIYDLVRYN